VTARRILAHTMDPVTRARRRLAPLIARINSIRNENRALQSDWSLEFHPVDNDQLIAYSKRAGDNEILVVVNLDVRNPQSGLITFPPCEVHDLVSGGRWVWTSPRNYVELSPHTLPAHVFRVTRA